MINFHLPRKCGRSFGLLLCGLVAVGRLAAAQSPEITYRHWRVTGPVLQAGPRGGFDEIAVKDPTVVFYDGNYHVFYTSKPAVKSSRFQTALGYAKAPTLEALRTAPHVEMRPILGDAMIAPQVFYFEPQKLWYLIGHIQEPETRKLEPVYSTNPDLNNVTGWTRLQRLQTDRQDQEHLWIDFWVICDERMAHLFYSDHTDALYRMECPLEEFPRGFARAREQLAVRASGRTARGDWNFHEAAHIYRVQSTGQYLALLEGGYSHPIRQNQLNARDARDRFMFALLADRLEGPWRRVEKNDDEFLGAPEFLFDGQGGRTKYTQVSHPELIRAGSNQRLEVPDFNFTLLFQGFDGTKFGNTYDYQELPWELAVMRNY